eukprot:13522121-Heterocapsa_arctica.AAC.1
MATSPSIPVAMRTSCDAKSSDEATFAYHYWLASCPWYKDPSLGEIHDSASKESCIIRYDEYLLSDQMFM